jgi:hypothetical protein
MSVFTGGGKLSLVVCKRATTRSPLRLTLNIICKPLMQGHVETYDGPRCVEIFKAEVGTTRTNGFVLHTHRVHPLFEYIDRGAAVGCLNCV